jgi:DNA-binding response OmpR family regulator
MNRADRKSKLLIVEDEWLLAEQIADALRDAGFDVVPPVPSVAAAIAIIEQETIGAAVLDIRLKDEDSFQLARELKRRGISIVFASGDARVELPADLDDYPLLSKPIRVEELVDALKAIIDL